MTSCSARWSSRRSSSSSACGLRPGAQRPPHQGCPGRRRAEGDAGAAPRAAHQRQSGERAAPADRHGAGWHRRREAAPGELHGGIGPAGRVPRQGLPMDADGGHRRRPRRGPRADRRQRGGRAGRRRDDDRRSAAWRPTRRSSCLNGRTASSPSGRRPPTRRDSLIDAKGLIATNQRVIGTATSVEVQLTPAVKVAASVLAADPRAGCRRPLDRSEGRSHRCGPCRWDARTRRSRPSRRAGDLHDRRSAPSSRRA